MSFVHTLLHIFSYIGRKTGCMVQYKKILCVESSPPLKLITSQDARVTIRRLPRKCFRGKQMVRRHKHNRRRKREEMFVKIRLGGQYGFYKKEL